MPPKTFEEDFEVSMFPSEEFVNSIKERYPAGTRICLDHMGDDPRPIPPGTKGTVSSVDDIGSVHVHWDNGRTLAVIPGEDSFHKITEKDRGDAR